MTMTHKRKTHSKLEVVSQPRITPEGKAQADSKAQQPRQYVSISRGLQRRHRGSDGVMKSLIYNQRGFTLVEILAVLIIMAIFTTTAIAKYSDIEDTAGRRMLETAVVQLNAHVRHAWFQSTVASGIGSYSYYMGTLGDNVVLTEQNPGKEPKGGTIFLKRDGVRYKLEWYPAPENHPGLFQLGDRTD
jgi:prepilin-type N-terminal cleavage/methylation domain-containing protein